MQFRAQGWSLFSTHCFQMLEMRPTKRSAEDVGLGDSTDFFAGDVENHDVVALKVEDVAPSGYTLDRATVRQKKTVTRFGSR